MKSVKYNIFLNNTSKQFSERGFECILAILLSLGVLVMLMFFPVAGISLAVFASCFLCIGVKAYLLSVAKNETMPIESIFFKFKICIKAFCLKFASILISLLWAVIFIIPGIISALNYSMASFIMAEDEKLSALECMVKSKKLVKGSRGEIFISYLAYMFVILVCMCLCVSLGIAMKTYTNVHVVVPIVSMCLLFLFLLFVFIVPYFELMFTNIYLQLKNYENDSKKKEAKTTRTSKSQTKTAVEQKS